MRTLLGLMLSVVAVEGAHAQQRHMYSTSPYDILGGAFQVALTATSPLRDLTDRESAEKCALAYGERMLRLALTDGTLPYGMPSAPGIVRFFDRTRVRVDFRATDARRGYTAVFHKHYTVRPIRNAGRVTALRCQYQPQSRDFLDVWTWDHQHVFSGEFEEPTSGEVPLPALI